MIDLALPGDVVTGFDRYSRIEFIGRVKTVDSGWDITQSVGWAFIELDAPLDVGELYPLRYVSVPRSELTIVQRCNLPLKQHHGLHAGKWSVDWAEAERLEKARAA